MHRMADKQGLRRAAVQRRSGLPQTDLTGVLADLLRQAATIASFVPQATEPGVPPQPGWLLPVLRDDDDLDWAVHEGTWTTGRRRLQEPAGPRLGCDAISACDLVLVPALLVDQQGTRLGRGGGSYDRALRRATGLTVALLHDGELVPALPAEEHDVPVKAAATPSLGVVRLPAKM